MSISQTLSGVTGIAYVALYADDPAAQAALYCEALGLELRGQAGNGPAFTGVPGRPGPTIVFFPRPEGAAAGTGFQRLALRVDSLAGLRAARRRLAERGLGGLEARNYGGAAIGLGFRDPEGNRVELLWHAGAAAAGAGGRPRQRFVAPIDLELDDEAVVAAMAEPPDPRRTVADGYDRVAERYARWVAEDVVDEARPRYTALLLERLRPGARVLELGCGGGGPTTRQLAERFELTGVDISRRQVELARANVPGATFVHADMTDLAFPAGSFAAVAAFYSLSHLPHGELPGMLRRIGQWLRPGGLLVASVSPRTDWGTTEDDWLGAPMYFSGYATEDTLRFVAEAGLTVESARVERIEENGEQGAFLWVVATRPGPRDGR